MNVNKYAIEVQHFQEAVAKANINVPENIDALCLEWLEKAIHEVELRPEREIGLKLLSIIRGIVN